MKKKIILLPIAVIMVVGTVIGGTLAARQASTDTRKSISTSSVDVGLKFGDREEDSGTIIEYGASEIKNGIVEEKVSGVNKGSRDVYIRISINKAWYDNNEKIFENAGKALDCRYIGIHTINESDWIIYDDDLGEGGNGEDIYFYYRKPVSPGTSTSELMDAFTLLKGVKENTNHYSGLQAKVRFDADAIQTTAAQDAMNAEWGVEAEFDAEGTIIGLQNQ